MLSLLHLKGVGLNDDGVPIGHVEDKKRACKNKLFRHLVDFARRSMVQQVACIVTPVVKDAVQHEANGIVSDDGDLACPGKKPEEIIHHFLVSTLPGDDLHGE